MSSSSNTSAPALLTKFVLAIIPTWLAKQWLCCRVVLSARCHSQPAVLLPHRRIMPQIIVDLSACKSSQLGSMAAEALRHNVIMLKARTS